MGHRGESGTTLSRASLAPTEPHSTFTCPPRSSISSATADENTPRRFSLFATRLVCPRQSMSLYESYFHAV
ncbi:hypothetical protein C4K08_0790 [Pseudomonas chlororaphis subsp. aureofaciens]|nr:hypothetical protein C4K08_0790 [Pseudomonas chlororaphis subsp. aureofaciens]